ncbi:hypothetical protein CCE02nite_23890 [Cellulosimicrobium cellulans]|uniref:Uncharacterized protein n=1 Tax=Cellulosimicrobium cellulans TaxID=1710 RepID=A0A4Y4E4D4_CELCE|nr:hypothetical protein CCE02nite_23890 [Cellulosimicrobium cellulans]
MGDGDRDGLVDEPAEHGRVELEQLGHTARVVGVRRVAVPVPVRVAVRMAVRVAVRVAVVVAAAAVVRVVVPGGAHASTVGRFCV